MKQQGRRALGAILAIAGVMGGGSALGAEEKVTQLVPEGKLKPAPDERRDGWDGSLRLSATLSLAQNSNVVGQPQGVSFLMGTAVVGALSWTSGGHELKNTLTLIEAFSKTPAVGSLVKSNDLAVLESLYSYYVLPWLGAFGRVTFEAPILPTNDVRANEVSYLIARRDGTTFDVEVGSERLLASSFDPLTMSQSLGAVARPVDTEPGVLTFRLGAGARETLAAGTSIVSDVSSTPQIEVKELRDVTQGGVEAALGLSGKFPEQRLDYSIDVGVLLPLLNNDPSDRGAFDLLRIGIVGAVNFSMWEWLLLSYTLKITRDPQLIEDAQIQNNVLLSFKWDVIPEAKVEKPAEPDPKAELSQAQEAARLAEERARLAEERARLAEERARSLEEKAKPVTP